MCSGSLRSQTLWVGISQVDLFCDLELFFQVILSWKLFLSHSRRWTSHATHIGSVIRGTVLLGIPQIRLFMEHAYQQGSKLHLRGTFWAYYRNTYHLKFTRAKTWNFLSTLAYMSLLYTGVSFIKLHRSNVWLVLKIFPVIKYSVLLSMLKAVTLHGLSPFSTLAGI